MFILLIYFFFYTFALSLLLIFLFFFLSFSEKWELHSSSIFECGFTSYFYSRFSFSIHFFLLALIFLFLDLELCFFLPFFNEEESEMSINLVFFGFLFILLLGLLEEWVGGKLDWKF